MEWKTEKYSCCYFAFQKTNKIFHYEVEYIFIQKIIRNNYGEEFSSQYKIIFFLVKSSKILSATVVLEQKESFEVEKRFA